MLFIKKQELIKDDFQKSIRLLLLKILSSQDIKNRFQSIVDSVSQKESHYKAIIAILTLNIAGFNIDLDDLIYMLDDDRLLDSSFSNNNNLKEIIDFRSNKIMVKSSILSETLILNLESLDNVIDILIELCYSLDKKTYNYDYAQILREITSYRFANRLFSNIKDNYRETLIYYFESVKNIKYNKRNPYFWLQYAITRLSIKQYELAEQYIQTAYSYGKERKNFDTYQIDTYYAKFILENTIYNGNPDTCIESFLKAHSFLTKTNERDERKHLSIAVAILYNDFYTHYFNDLNEQEQVIFLKCCQEILSKIATYLNMVPSARHSRDVIKCKRLLSAIINPTTS